MRSVGVSDAQTQLFRLLDEVERGATVIITRRGRPVARLVPVTPPRRTTAAAIEALLAFRDAQPLDGLSVRELIGDGRRH